MNTNRNKIQKQQQTNKKDAGNRRIWINYYYWETPGCSAAKDSEYGVHSAVLITGDMRRIGGILGNSVL